MEYIATLETLDNGKTYSNALFDIEASIETIRYYAAWCDKIFGDTIPVGMFDIVLIKLTNIYEYL